VTVSPSQAIYHFGDTPTITASASAGYVFAGWTVAGGLVSGNTGSDSLTVRGDVSLTASFTTAPHKLGTIDPTLGVVNPSDLIILNARLNGLNIWPYTDSDGDLSGDGYVTTADRVMLNKILNGLTPHL
jgi:uncharacterized repeat protein (TIGR02543 family)